MSKKNFEERTGTEAELNGISGTKLRFLAKSERKPTVDSYVKAQASFRKRHTYQLLKENDRNGSRTAQNGLHMF
jgi:hypothetical protein